MKVLMFFVFLPSQQKRLLDMAGVGHRVTIDNLPFNPVRGQVIFVDSDNNKRINSFIVSNYDWLRSMFRVKGLDFC